MIRAKPHIVMVMGHWGLGWFGDHHVARELNTVAFHWCKRMNEKIWDRKEREADIYIAAGLELDALGGQLGVRRILESDLSYRERLLVELRSSPTQCRCITRKLP